MSINLAQLRAFHAVASEGSFTRAGQRLGVTQPTVSGQVRRLEETHDVRLFERHGRAIRPTDMGARLLKITGRLFGLQDEAAELLTGARQPDGGYLKIGADGPYHVLPMVARLRDMHPNIDIALYMGNSAEVMADLTAYRTDVGVLADVQADPGLIAQPLTWTGAVAIVHRDHPWSRRRSIRFDALNGETVILREKGSSTRKIFDHAAADTGTAPGRVMEINTREAVREAVAAKLGIGVIVESEIGADRRLVPLSFEDRRLGMTEYVICLKDRRRLGVIRAFMDLARRHAANG